MEHDLDLVAHIVQLQPLDHDVLSRLLQMCKARFFVDFLLLLDDSPSEWLHLGTLSPADPLDLVHVRLLRWLVSYQIGRQLLEGAAVRVHSHVLHLCRPPLDGSRLWALGRSRAVARAWSVVRIRVDT